MCMTLNGNQLNEIAKGLIITKPNIYYNTMQNVKNLPDLANLSNIQARARHNYSNFLTINVKVGDN